MAVAEYDAENVFAKIIDGKLPCFKVFETKTALAFLDAFPIVEGHTVFVPKAKGAMNFLEMPPFKAAEFMRDMHKVAKAVQKATGADGINIWMNNGEGAGQTVMHPHWHIVPRMQGDSLNAYPKSGAQVSESVGKPLVEKIKLALNPPPPLKKPKSHVVGKIKPMSKGLNLEVQVIEAAQEVSGKKASFWEARCGDTTGSVVVSFTEAQKAMLSVGKVIMIRNASTKMINGHIRLTVDKWGKIEESSASVEAEKDPAKNVSALEYELARA